MSFIQENILLIVCILLALIVCIEGLIIYKQSNKKGSSKSGSSNSVSKEKYKKLESDCKNKEKKYKELIKEYAKLTDINERYGKTCMQNAELKRTVTELDHTVEKLKEEKRGLKQQIRELEREIDELNKRDGIEPTLYGAEETITIIQDPNLSESESEEGPADKAPTETSQSSAQETASIESVQEPNEEPKEELKSDSTSEPKAESPKEIIMYASFPRSAESRNYFSDLSENRVDDSYFELKVDAASGKATFRPLDFMKIRNYDSAMAAMFTEGAMPNVASIVQGIEPGKAHKEGKDWIIDNPAKIKLA